MSKIFLAIIFALFFINFASAANVGKVVCQPKDRDQAPKICPMFITAMCVFYADGTTKQIMGNGCKLCQDLKVTSYSTGNCDGSSPFLA